MSSAPSNVQWSLSTHGKTALRRVQIRAEPQNVVRRQPAVERFLQRKGGLRCGSSFSYARQQNALMRGSSWRPCAAMVPSIDAPPAQVDLYSAWYCPFAQRAWMALEQKRVDYRLVETDPYDKTPEFLAANPRGLVPAIVCRDVMSIYESTVCVEFVDEAWGDDNMPKLFPESAYERAFARIWIDFVGRQVVPCYYKILRSQDAAEREEYKEKMLEHIKEMTEAMTSDGDFFMGKSLGAVDIALAPFAWRFGILKHYRGFNVPDSPEYGRFHKWWKVVQSCPSFQATTCEYDELIARNAKYDNIPTKSQVA